jgi:hypothetical protein
MASVQWEGILVHYEELGDFLQATYCFYHGDIYDNTMGWLCSEEKEANNAYKIFVGKCPGERALGRQARN